MDTLSILTASTAFLFDSANQHVILLLATLFTTTLGKHVQDAPLQFSRSRFGRTWVRAGYLVSLKPLVLLVLLLFLLPAGGRIQSE